MSTTGDSFPVMNNTQQGASNRYAGLHHNCVGLYNHWQARLNGCAIPIKQE